MPRLHAYFVYILASRRNGTLYVGDTNDLISRAHEHREGLVPGFTKRYAVKLLVYFEEHSDMNEAILREKRIKRWRRKWKLELIESQNPALSGTATSLVIPDGAQRRSGTHGPRPPALLGASGRFLLAPRRRRLSPAETYGGKIETCV